MGIHLDGIGAGADEVLVGGLFMSVEFGHGGYAAAGVVEYGGADAVVVGGACIFKKSRE